MSREIIYKKGINERREDMEFALNHLSSFSSLDSDCELFMESRKWVNMFVAAFGLPEVLEDTAVLENCASFEYAGGQLKINFSETSIDICLHGIETSINGGVNEIKSIEARKGLLKFVTKAGGVVVVKEWKGKFLVKSLGDEQV